jgi:hypothetical protein
MAEDKKGDLDKFLKGEPQNEEIAALMQGEATPAESLPALTSPRDVRELDDDDREHLRRLQLEPGWKVLLRLVDRDIDNEEALVKKLSLADPLGNRDEVVNGWAYVAMLRRGRDRMIYLTDAEIKKLDGGRGQ